MSSPDERLTQRSGIETRPLPKGAILVDMATGRCYRLNHVGAAIWSLLRAPLTRPQICEEIVAKYGARAETVEGDVHQLLAHLVAERLVEPATDGGAT